MGLFAYVRLDGIDVWPGCEENLLTVPTEDPIRIQGGRTYDSGAVQWTTPDAFAGDPSDPVSQMKFMWNGENPVSYSDPSGFVPSENETAAEAALVARLNRVTSFLENEARYFREALGVPKSAPKFPDGVSQISHIFRTEAGHVQDSALNRALLQKAASDPNNLSKIVKLPDGSLLQQFRQMLPSGGQAWVYVRNGVIENGGINLQPKP